VLQGLAKIFLFIFEDVLLNLWLFSRFRNYEKLLRFQLLLVVPRRLAKLCLGSKFAKIALFSKFEKVTHTISRVCENSNLVLEIAFISKNMFRCLTKSP
jgi:hypothetical protein